MHFQKFYERQLNGSRVRTDITLLLLWQLWKARNATIFNKENSSPSDILRRVAKDWNLGPADTRAAPLTSISGRTGSAWNFDVLLLYSLISSPFFLLNSL